MRESSLSSFQCIFEITVWLFPERLWFLNFWYWCSNIPKVFPICQSCTKMLELGERVAQICMSFVMGKKGIKWMLVSTNMHFLSWEKERRKVNIWEWQIWEGGWFIIHCVTIKPLSCLCHSHYQPAELFVIGKLGKFDQMVWLEVGDNKYRRGGGL